MPRDFESERPFKRAGFQPDGSYIQQISRKTEGENGVLGYFPPIIGERIITRLGPLTVDKVSKTYQVIGRNGQTRYYFRAIGRVGITSCI